MATLDLPPERCQQLKNHQLHRSSARQSRKEEAKRQDVSWLGSKLKQPAEEIYQSANLEKMVKELFGSSDEEEKPERARMKTLDVAGN